MKPCCPTVSQPQQAKALLHLFPQKLLKVHLGKTKVSVGILTGRIYYKWVNWVLDGVREMVTKGNNFLGRTQGKGLVLSSQNSIVCKKNPVDSGLWREVLVHRKWVEAGWGRSPLRRYNCRLLLVSLRSQDETGSGGPKKKPQLVISTTTNPGYQAEGIWLGRTWQEEPVHRKAQILSLLLLSSFLSFLCWQNLAGSQMAKENCCFQTSSPRLAKQSMERWISSWKIIALFILLLLSCLLILQVSARRAFPDPRDRAL